MQNKSIEIRDLRNQDWLWTSKNLLFHEKIDGNNYKVYCGLASYANNDTQEAFPSIDTLSLKLHLSRNTVIKSLSILEKHGFIKIEKTTGEHNVYVLLSVAHADTVKTKWVDEETKEPAKEEKPTAPPSPAPAENGKPSLFERFWAIYPNHANKKTAEKKFAKLKKETIITMVNDVKKRKVEHDQWLKGFIPHLATYINQERWNDPIIKPTGEKERRDNGPAIHPELRKKLFRERNETRYNETVDNPTSVKSVADLLKA